MSIYEKNGFRVVSRARGLFTTVIFREKSLAAPEQPSRAATAGGA
jgi:hypothetical protein